MARMSLQDSVVGISFSDLGGMTSFVAVLATTLFKVVLVRMTSAVGRAVIEYAENSKMTGSMAGPVVIRCMVDVARIRCSVVVATTDSAVVSAPIF